MRRLVFSLCGLVLATASAAAQPGRSVGFTLSEAELERYIAPYASVVGECYQAAGPARTATGEVALRVSVERGVITRLAVEAPGVTGRAHARLARCIRAEARHWRFPVRRAETRAVLPFRFVHTLAEGAGPYPSCYSPRGCGVTRQPPQEARRERVRRPRPPRA